MDDKEKIRDERRKDFLEKLALNEVEGDVIRQLVASIIIQMPEIFDDYQVNAILDAIEPDALDWSAAYFDRQRKFAQSNFSKKRIDHLIDVRDHLIQNGVAGFAKAPTGTPSYGNQAMPTQMNIADYIPGDNLAKIVHQGTPGLVRSALISELEDNRLEETEINCALAWSQAQVANLFADYEENTLAGKMTLDSSDWDEDYYYLQTSYINVNFAKNRFEHLIAVRNTLRQRGVKGFERIYIKKPQQQPSAHSAAPSPSPTSTRPSDPASQPGFLRFALMAGGALAVLAALLVSLL